MFKISGGLITVRNDFWGELMEVSLEYLMKNRPWVINALRLKPCGMGRELRDNLWWNGYSDKVKSEWIEKQKEWENDHTDEGKDFLHRGLHLDIHSSFIRNSSKLEIA